MAGIKSKNTKPELIIRKGLHSAGFRYRLHHKQITGRPDLVLKKYNALIFIHGCFWHQHECHLFKWPKSRKEFWKGKIGENRLRDEGNISALLANGWRVLIIWECAIKGKTKLKNDDLFESISSWLISDRSYMDISGGLG